MQFPRPIPLSFESRGPTRRPSSKVSHLIVGLAVLVLGVFGVVQVIDSEAQTSFRDLSSASNGFPFVATTPLASSGHSSQASALTDRADQFDQSGFTPESLLEKREVIEVAPASPTPANGGDEQDKEDDALTTALAETEDGICPPVGPGLPYCIYVVQDGDTLSEIAASLGISNAVAFSGAELVALSNGLNDALNWIITPGQELRIPIQSGVIHTVGESDTVSFLAEIYGITTAELIAANAFAEPDTLPVGETILIPSPTLWPWTGPGMAVDAPEEEPDPDAEAEATEEAPATQETAALADATEPEPTAEIAAATEEPTATATAIPTEEPAPATRSAAASNPSVGSVRDEFAAGYVAAGGPPQYLEKILSTVIPCESGYNVRAYNPAGPFYGLMQFLPQTWANSGGGDWFDAWQQGHNTGNLLKTSSPSTQWPSCWRG